MARWQRAEKNNMGKEEIQNLFGFQLRSNGLDMVDSVCDSKQMKNSTAENVRKNRTKKIMIKYEKKLLHGDDAYHFYVRMEGSCNSIVSSFFRRQQFLCVHTLKKKNWKRGRCILYSHLLYIRTSDTVHAFNSDKNYTNSLLTAIAWMLMKGKRNSLATITAVLFY